MSKARVASAEGRSPFEHVEEVRGVARAPDPAGSARRPPAAGRKWRRCCPSARSGGPPCGTAPAASCRSLRDRTGRAPTSASAACPCRPTAAAASSAAGSAPTPDARRPAATAGRPARRGSVTARARAGSRPLRTSRPSRGRGCRGRSTQERRDRHPGNKWRRSRRRRLRDRPWASHLCRHIAMISAIGIEPNVRPFKCHLITWRFRAPSPRCR